MWCSAKSPVTRASRNGHRYSSVNVRSPSSTPGKNGFGISKPNALISHPGMIRSAPSSQPMYQSGCDAAETCAGVERAEHPDRVDLHQAAEEAQHRGDEEEQAECLRRVRRPHPLADDVVLLASRARELRVLVAHDERQVGAEQHRDERRHDQDVDHVEAADDVGPGNSPPNSSDAIHVPIDRDRQHDRVRDAQAGARELVVEQRVAGEPVDHREDQQRHADHPVDLARPAERAGEEDPREVHDDRGDEQQRRPVVDLAHHEPGPDVEAEVERRLVRLRHRARPAAARSCPGRRRRSCSDGRRT